MSNKDYIASLTSKFAEAREKKASVVFTNRDTVVPTSFGELNPFNNSLFNLYRSLGDPSILTNDYMYYQSDGDPTKQVFQNLGDAAAAYTMGRGAGNVANRLYYNNLFNTLGLQGNTSLASNMHLNPTATAQILGLNEGGRMAASGNQAGSNARTGLNSWGPTNGYHDLMEAIQRSRNVMPSNTVPAGVEPVSRPVDPHSTSTVPSPFTQVQQAFRAAAELRNASGGAPSVPTAPQPQQITTIGKQPRGGQAPPPLNSTPATDWAREQFGAATTPNPTGNTVFVQPKSGPVVDFVSSRIPGGGVLQPSVREVAPTEALNSRLNTNRSRWEGRGGLAGLGLLLGRNLLDFGSPVSPASTGVSYDQYGNLLPQSQAKVDRSQAAQ